MLPHMYPHSLTVQEPLLAVVVWCLRTLEVGVLKSGERGERGRPEKEGAYHCAGN